MRKKGMPLKHNTNAFKNHCGANSMRTVSEGIHKAERLVRFVPLAGAREAKVGYDPTACQYVVSSPSTQLVDRLNIDEITLDGVRLRATTESLESRACITTDKEYDHREDSRIHKVSSSKAPEDRDQWVRNNNRIWILLGGTAADFGENGEYIAQLSGGTQRQAEFNAAHITDYGTSLVAVPTNEDLRILKLKEEVQQLASNAQALMQNVNGMGTEIKEEIKELTSNIEELARGVSALGVESIKQKIDSNPQLKNALDRAESQAKNLVVTAKEKAGTALTKASQWLEKQAKTLKK